ncbi:NADH-quinone oxidoreductase subunit N [uncultured Chloroflexus sp.]|uniref:NADH-quinone oxidoreductase subunit N n=1 Tax=uncultured Chloroflexus sp. TaxID=214040 RepID=UPI0026137AEF|nr:NADH-quinone oxidoreductase subunit N [uncultured Chloroflexus sp.]
MFQLTDIPRLLPEILLLVLALLVLGSDILEKWGRTPEAQLERVKSSASLTSIGLVMVLAVALLQSGYLYQLPETAPVNFFTNIIRNLQSGGPGGDPVAGVFVVDHLTMIARLLIIGSALLISLLCLDVRPTAHPGEFYALIVFATLGMCLMVGAKELLLAYLAIELTSIPLYLLAGYFRNEARSAEAGLKYFLFGAISSAILLYGMSIAFGAALNGVSGAANMNDLTRFDRIGAFTPSGGGLITLAMLFIVAGMGYKLAVVPFHAWSPDVYEGAPTPITAFISTASKAAGFILLFRLLTETFPAMAGAPVLGEAAGGWTGVLAVLALLTVVFGNLAALPQNNAKRLLAYSSIAHAGFVVLGLLAWAAAQQFDREQGLVALLYYLIIYSLTNIGAFGALALIGQQVGGDDFEHLRGLARRNLPLALLFTVCILSLAGIPPLGGFFAKFYIFMAGWQSGATWLVVIAVVMTIVSLYYYLRLLKVMFIEPAVDMTPVPMSRGVAAALTITAVGVLALGIFPNVILSVLERA